MQGACHALTSMRKRAGGSTRVVLVQMNQGGCYPPDSVDGSEAGSTLRLNFPILYRIASRPMEISLAAAETFPPVC